MIKIYCKGCNVAMELKKSQWKTKWCRDCSRSNNAKMTKERYRRKVRVIKKEDML